MKQSTARTAVFFKYAYKEGTFEENISNLLCPEYSYGIAKDHAVAQRYGRRVPGLLSGGTGW